MSEQRTVNARWHMPDHTRDARLRDLPLKAADATGSTGEYLLEGQARTDLTAEAAVLRITHRPTQRVLTVNGNVRGSRYDRASALLVQVVGRAVASALTDTPHPRAERAVATLFDYCWTEGLTRPTLREREVELRVASTGISRKALDEWLSTKHWGDTGRMMGSGEAIGLLWAAGLTPHEAATFITGFNDAHAADPSATLLRRFALHRLDATGAEYVARLVRSGHDPGWLYRSITSIPTLRDVLLPEVNKHSRTEVQPLDPRWQQVPDEWAFLALFAGLSAEEAVTAYADGSLDEDTLRFMAAIS